MTPLEKAYAKMTPAERKKATAAISGMMGANTKKKAPTTKKTSTKKK